MLRVKKNKKKFAFEEFCDVKASRDIKENKRLVDLAQYTLTNLVSYLTRGNFCQKIEKMELNEMLLEMRKKYIDKLPENHQVDLEKSILVFNEMVDTVADVIKNKAYFIGDKESLVGLLSKYEDILSTQSEVVETLNAEVIESLYKRVFDEICHLEKKRHDIFNTMVKMCKNDPEEAKTTLRAFLRNILYLQTNTERLRDSLDRIIDLRETRKAIIERISQIDHPLADDARFKSLKLANARFVDFEKRVNSGKQKLLDSRK